MTSSSWEDSLSRGLDLGATGSTTDEERAGFWADKMVWQGGRMAYPLTSYAFLLQNRPDMLKLQMRQLQFLHAVPADGEMPMAVTSLTMLHWYTTNRVPAGMMYELRSSQELGATKAQVNEVFALAFMTCGSVGFDDAYRYALDHMATYREADRSIAWPSGWAPDPAAFASGLDFERPAMTQQECELLEAWYINTIGHVPRSVELLRKYNPGFLKQYRAKLEGALSTGALPKQLVPYILIHHNLNRGFRDGIREAALMAKTWGVTRDQVINALVLGTGYLAGLDALYVVDEAIGDLLEDWD